MFEIDFGTNGELMDTPNLNKQCPWPELHISVWWHDKDNKRLWTGGGGGVATQWEGNL